METAEGLCDASGCGTGPSPLNSLFISILHIGSGDFFFSCGIVTIDAGGPFSLSRQECGQKLIWIPKRYERII
ncbi:hypothetical protein R69919_03191 [Paraburkholderia gardini]|nr:hypothetical protein R69919_03191 [Paraburkholderia gardini]